MRPARPGIFKPKHYFFDMRMKDSPKAHETRFNGGIQNKIVIFRKFLPVKRFFHSNNFSMPEMALRCLPAPRNYFSIQCNYCSNRKQSFGNIFSRLLQGDPHDLLVTHRFEYSRNLTAWGTGIRTPIHGFLPAQAGKGRCSTQLDLLPCLRKRAIPCAHSWGGRVRTFVAGFKVPSPTTRRPPSCKHKY